MPRFDRHVLLLVASLAVIDCSQSTRADDAFSAASQLYQDGQWQQAADAFERLAEDGQQPQATRLAAKLYVGEALMQQGDFVEAERLYTRALRENPFYFPAYNNRGLVSMRLGLFRQAYKDFDLLVRRDPRDHVARERRQVAQQQMHVPKLDPFDHAYEQLPYSAY